MALADLLDGRLDGLTLSLVLGGALVALYWRVFVLRLDPQEPPILKPRIPVIGHVLGIIQYSHAYLPKLYKSQRIPACTLPMLNGKMYVLNEPGLITAAFRARTLSFDPYLFKTLRHMIPISAEAMAQFQSPEDFFEPWLKVIYSKMTGPDLFRLNVSVLGDIFGQINQLPLNMEVEDTYVWFRNMLTTSTVTSLLGRENPWKSNRKLIYKYWEWESQLVHFVLGPAPSLTASAAYKARAEIHEALIKCNFSSGAPQAPEVSTLIKAAVAIQDEHHWSVSDKAAMMIAILQGALSNTIPTAYWYFMHILSSPRLVAKLRKELEPLVVPTATLLPNGKKEMVLDARGLEEKAPLLVAAFRENQRVVGVGSINRWVVADTLLTSATDPDQTYLLKKDFPVQISSQIGHASEEHWGPDAAEFKPERFLRPEGGEDTKEKDEREFHGDAPVPRGAFIPFGGGKHLCPGRNFASVENWGTMIAFLLGFEITTPEGSPLVVPGRTLPTPTQGIGKPIEGADLRLSIRRRKGWENVVWKVAEIPSSKTT